MKTIAIVSCLFPLFLFSCKKDSGNQWTTPKIKTAKTESGSATSYYYDKEGRITKAEDAGYKQEFTYELSKVIAKTTELASGGIETISYELNAEGYASKKGNTSYSYTPEGYVKNIVTTNPNGSSEIRQYYYNAVSKLLDSVVNTKGANWIQTSIYTFHTDKNETTGNENTGVSFAGKSMPHPLKSVTYWAPKQGIPYREIWRTENYSHLYNEAGRIVKTSASVVSFGQGSSSSTIYTYY